MILYILVVFYKHEILTFYCIFYTKKIKSGTVLVAILFIEELSNKKFEDYS